MKEWDAGVKWFYTDFYPKHKTSRAVRLEEEVLPRLHKSEVILFTPWGPRYGWQRRGVNILPGDREVEALQFLAALLDQWREYIPGRHFRWLVFGADLYGTRINMLPCEPVADYFASLAEWLERILPSVEFKLWSAFDTAAEPYRQKARDGFTAYIDRSILVKAIHTARTAGLGDPKEYLVERMAEAMFVEKTFHPIKVSCVSRGKDDGVDMALPRLYFLPERLHAPWL